MKRLIAIAISLLFAGGIVAGCAGGGGDAGGSVIPTPTSTPTPTPTSGPTPTPDAPPTPPG